MMEDKRDFDVSLSYGQIAEEEVRELLTGWCVDPSHVRIEVKRDNVIQRTGNLFIEYSYRGYPSGIAVTKSDWFAVALAGTNDRVMIFLETKWLRNRLDLLWISGLAKRVQGGDENQSMGYLVNLYDLIRGDI